jgi:hypothetical protein
MNEYIYEYEGYQIKPHRETPSCYIVVTSGKGGKIPDILSGMFTTRTIAKQNIDMYLANKPVKDKTNGETISTGGSK